jgi:hypothetical protein
MVASGRARRTAALIGAGYLEAVQTLWAMVDSFLARRDTPS